MFALVSCTSLTAGCGPFRWRSLGERRTEVTVLAEDSRAVGRPGPIGDECPNPLGSTKSTNFSVAAAIDLQFKPELSRRYRTGIRYSCETDE